MSKGRFLKAAERACTRKARFETAASAEAFVERRYRAYRCVVCGGYHLTSGRGDREEVAPPKPKDASGPKLRDLDWSAVLDPKPKIEKPMYRPEPKPPKPPPRRVRCAGVCAPGGKVKLIVDGKLSKSRPVDAELRGQLAEGVWVEIDDDLKILRLAPANP